MAQRIDGRAIAKKIESNLIKRIQKLKKNGVVPHLQVILIGNDKASETYVATKGKAAERVGVTFTLHRLPKKTTEAKLIATIETIQKNKSTSGILIQLPLPEHLYTEKVLNSINPNLDVDCLTNVNLGRLVMNNPFVTPPTPAASLTVLEHLAVKLKGKNVTVIGTGALVGKPLAIMLVNAGASVTTINSRTNHTKEKCLGADIIITGVGKKNIVRGDMVKPGAIVIDTGFVYENGVLSGDINFEEVSKVASHVTPTPGGIGPITVARLLSNTVLCAEHTI